MVVPAFYPFPYARFWSLKRIGVYYSVVRPALKSGDVIAGVRGEGDFVLYYSISRNIN